MVILGGFQHTYSHILVASLTQTGVCFMEAALRVNLFDPLPLLLKSRNAFIGRCLETLGFSLNSTLECYSVQNHIRNNPLDAPLTGIALAPRGSTDMRAAVKQKYHLASLLSRY